MSNFSRLLLKNNVDELFCPFRNDIEYDLDSDDRLCRRLTQLHTLLWMTQVPPSVPLWGKRRGLVPCTPTLAAGQAQQRIARL